MMARQTRYPAIRAAATIANPDGFAVVPCEAIESAQAEPCEHWQRHRPDNNRIQLPKEFISNLERSDVVRVGKSGPRASHLAPKKSTSKKCG
jgi:hypothetical protein